MSSEQNIRDKSLTSALSSSLSPFEPTTVVELLRWRALHQPAQPAYTFLVDGEMEEAQITYGELDRKARAIGALLQSMGVSGGRALLLYPSGLEYITAFFGCLYADVIAVPAYPPRPAKPNRNLPRLRAIVDDCRPALALSVGPILSALTRRVEQDPHLSSMRFVSTDGVDDALAEHWQEPLISNETLAFLQQWVPMGKSPMCGNSICQDRRFLYRQMPRLERFFHYRNLDVSTLKELARRWAPAVYKGFSKDSAHTALSDIRDSIDELRYYRAHMGELAGA